MTGPALIASVFSGGGTPGADVVAIAIAIAVFVFLFWAIDLIDRI
jgi:small neutral amino acid transporter SnatA (MarC family)